MGCSKVIFLDVDGVLNDVHTETKSPSGFIGLNPDMVKNLRKIVDATGAKIILTSTWKKEWSDVPENRSFDGQYLADILELHNIAIFNKTVDRMFDRGRGIAEWLRDHPEGKRWVVLDDDVFDDYKEYGVLDHLVHTSFLTGGLTSESADQAIDMLMKE